MGTQPLRVSLSIDYLSQLEGNAKVGEIEVRDEDDGENGEIEIGVLSPHDRYEEGEGRRKGEETIPDFSLSIPMELFESMENSLRNI